MEINNSLIFDGIYEWSPDNRTKLKVYSPKYIVDINRSQLDVKPNLMQTRLTAQRYIQPHEYWLVESIEYHDHQGMTNTTDIFRLLPKVIYSFSILPKYCIWVETHEEQQGLGINGISFPYLINYVKVSDDLQNFEWFKLNKEELEYLYTGNRINIKEGVDHSPGFLEIYNKYKAYI